MPKVIITYDSQAEPKLHIEEHGMHLTASTCQAIYELLSVKDEEHEYMPVPLQCECDGCASCFRLSVVKAKLEVGMPCKRVAATDGDPRLCAACAIETLVTA